MGGSHAHAAPRPSRRARRLAVLLLVPLAALTAIAMAVLWPDGDVAGGERAAPELEAVVTAITTEECPEDLPDDVNGCGTAALTLDDGAEVDAPLPNGAGAPRLEEGDDVLVTSTDGPDGATYAVVDHQRGTTLLVVCLAFALALLAFGRLRGLAALLGLAVTFGILLVFVVPAVLGGSDPLLVAVVGASAIVLTVLFLTHGPTPVTTVAVVGTLASLTLTGALAALATAALHLTGVTDDLAGSVQTTYGVDMAGLLVASIIIGSVGVLDDVTVTQAATVAELSHANPAYRFRQLYGAAARVGRAHIASVVNTIVLAYAGSSLPLLLLIAADNDSLSQVASTQLVTQEIVRSVVATTGLVAAVPITTALAALTVRERREERA